MFLGSFIRSICLNSRNTDSLVLVIDILMLNCNIITSYLIFQPSAVRIKKFLEYNYTLTIKIICVDFKRNIFNTMLR